MYMRQRASSFIGPRSSFPMKVLIVEDQPAVAQGAPGAVRAARHRAASTAEPGRGAAADGAGRRRRRCAGHELLARRRRRARRGSRSSARSAQRDPDLPVLLLTAWTPLETAVQLVKDGAADYLAKPWDDAKLLATVRNLLRAARAAARERAPARRADRARARTLARELRPARRSSTRARRCTRVVSLALPGRAADVPVLITGPNGAGKEKLAEIVQANSRRTRRSRSSRSTPARCPTS